MPPGRLIRSSIAVAAALACSGAAALPVFAQAPAAPAAPGTRDLSAVEWRADLKFMAAEMERRHKNLFHAVSRERFAAAVAALDAQIPHLRRHEIIVGMMRIAAMVGDGHTVMGPLKDGAVGFHGLPVKLYRFDDGLYVRAAAPDRAELVGAKVEAFAGVPVNEALRRVGEITSADNDWGRTFYASAYLAMPEILNALKLSPRPDAAVLTLSKGARRWTVTLPAAGVEPVWPPDTDISLVTPAGWVDARGAAAQPLWLQAPLDIQRMVELPDQKALYIQLNMVADTKTRSLNDFGREALARAHETNPHAVILDLRLDRGGNGDLRNGLVRDLIRAEDADTRLFVLVGRGTFSASQFILDDLDRLSGAVLVGEPASSKPNAYGDGYKIALPNSGLTARVSIYWWQVDQKKRDFTPIDVAAPLTFTAYVSGRDPALEAALAWRPGPSLAGQLLAAAQPPGDVLQALAAWRADPANRYADAQRELVLAGRTLFRAGHPQAAIAVTEAGARQFPQSGDLFTLLAVVADRAGRKDLALPAAARALELDPDNRTVRDLVERVGPGG